MNILTVIPCHSADAQMAENLLDWIFQLAERKKAGSLLVVCYGDTHEEMRMKLFLASDVAYDNHDLVVTPEIGAATKTERITHVFNFAANHIAKNYRVPWLWLEPDSVPLKRGWQKENEEGYELQPKKHMGPHFQTAERRVFMGRTSVFSPDLVQPVLPQFAPANADTLTPAASRTRLIQQIYYKHPQDLEKIKPDACLLHSDKSGMLINHLREKL